MSHSFFHFGFSSPATFSYTTALGCSFWMRIAAAVSSCRAIFSRCWRSSELTALRFAPEYAAHWSEMTISPIFPLLFSCFSPFARSMILLMDAAVPMAPTYAEVSAPVAAWCARMHLAFVSAAATTFTFRPIEVLEDRRQRRRDRRRPRRVFARA